MRAAGRARATRSCVAAARGVPRRGRGRRGRRRRRPRLVRVDRRLPAGHPGAAAGRADHRRDRRLPARAARRRARACTARATRASRRSASCARLTRSSRRSIELIGRALAEDVGDGDVTTEATVDAGRAGRATITQKEPGVIFGLDVAEAVFRRARSRARRSSGSAPEGDWREPAAPCCASRAAPRALLTAERTALNFLGAPVGRRDADRAVVRAMRRGGRRRADPRHAQDHAGPAAAREARRWRPAAASTTASGSTTRSSSRRTTPRSRAASARRCGARAQRGPDLPLEVEVRDAGGDRRGARGRRAAAAARQHDARTSSRAAVAQVAGRAELEASRRRRPRTQFWSIATIEGLDYISVGALTHSAPGARPLPDSWRPLPMSPRSPSRTSPPLQAEVRALAAERDAVILAHNYQVPEVQDVADYVGDSLGLSQQAAAADAERDRLLRRALHGRDGVDPLPGQDGAAPRPRRRLLAGRLDHRRRSCAPGRPSTPARSSSCTSTRRPRSRRETDYCVTSSNAVAVVEHIYREHGEDTEILFGPDMFLGAYVEKTIGRTMHVWDGECHVHAGIRPRDITDDARRAPGRRLPHPPRVRLLDLGHGVRRRRRRRPPRASTCSRPAGCSTTPHDAPPGGDGDRGDRDRHAAPAADGRARRRLRRRQRGGELPLHEDDHAAEAARRAARRRAAWSRCPRRSPSAPGCRSSAWSRSADGGGDRRRRAGPPGSPRGRRPTSRSREALPCPT